MSFLSNMKVKIKKNSPEICIITGIIGGVVATVFACKATLKIDDVLTEAQEKINKIHNSKDNPELTDKYSKEDAKKDLALVYIQTGAKLAKLYAPALAIGGVSIGLILSGHKIMKNRYLGISAAYAAVDGAFKEYRENVKERFGEDVDFQLKNNIKAEEIEETTVDENGKKKKEKKTVYDYSNVKPSAYAKFFDKTADFWEDDAEYNLMFLKKVQCQFNDMFRKIDAKTGKHPVIFLNDAYKALGIQTTRAGQMIGWVWDDTKPYEENYIDFGLYNDSEATRRFVNGLEPCILLDFNVTGNVLEQMDEAV